MLIVCAGMEGALPTVVAGLVNAPVMAVPTSVGYGASFGGVAALLGMLNYLLAQCVGGQYRQRVWRGLHRLADQPSVEVRMQVLRDAFTFGLTASESRPMGLRRAPYRTHFIGKPRTTVLS